MNATAISQTPNPEYIAQLLEQAADFPDEAWIQGAEARDAAGQECYPFQDKAVKFCALGRLNRVCSRQQSTDPIRATISRVLRELLPPSAEDNLARWNDRPERAAAEVRALFRQAAAQVRAAA